MKWKQCFFFFRRALKFAIGGKTEQGINCPSPYTPLQTSTQGLFKKFNIALPPKKETCDCFYMEKSWNLQNFQIFWNF